MLWPGNGLHGNPTEDNSHLDGVLACISQIQASTPSRWLLSSVGSPSEPLPGHDIRQASSRNKARVEDAMTRDRSHNSRTPARTVNRLRVQPDRHLNSRHKTRQANALKSSEGTSRYFPSRTN